MTREEFIKKIEELGFSVLEGVKRNTITKEDEPTMTIRNVIGVDYLIVDVDRIYTLERCYTKENIEVLILAGRYLKEIRKKKYCLMHKYLDNVTGSYLNLDESTCSFKLLILCWWR